MARNAPPGFPPVPGGYPFPDLERETLEFWRRERVFEASLEAREDSEGKEFSFYEGPPTANNVPHVGHVVTRVVKDLYPRFRTMTGRRVPRKGGWDTHGLPVEIEVEKQLGFSGKQQIEDYGIEKFNSACLESVGTYERQWRRMTERVGYWLDMDSAYRTYRNTYIESVWWALAQLRKKDLLYEGRKILPYCARCGTTLSSHEVAQNYRDTEDPSIWVRFPLRPGQTLRAIDADDDGAGSRDGIDGGHDGGHAVGGTHESHDGGHAAGAGAPFSTDRPIDIVAWTTTPWTLLSHAGIAVHPELTYRAVADPGDPERLLLIAEDLERPVPALVPGDGKPTRVDLREAPTVARFAGRSLEGVLYDRPFAVEPSRPYRPAEVSDDAGFRILLGDYVTLAEGTGAVHTAPLFGEDDERSGREYGLPELQAVDAEGKVALDAAASSPDAASQALIAEIDGEWFKDADPKIVRSLRQRGRLLHGERYSHSYPFCWRCDQPLLYYAATSWFVHTTAARDRLIEKNRQIRWHPEHVGEGRFGDWLKNLVDWAVSRSRYWGTPLPVWKCGDCDAVDVVGSFEELFRKVGRPLPDDPYDRSQFDPHRPFIDDFRWPCAASGCAGTMKRVEYVIDAWFDSGAMPFAQYHYPFENEETFRARFPADFISEAVDQTRGWFYLLHVLGCLLFDSPAYLNCIVLGHVNDENGRKMSKRLGNVVEPMEVVAETGADALRWYFCVNNPEQSSRFSARLVREAAQTFLLPLWNALSFFVIYANLDGWRPGSAEIPFAERGSLDRWVLLRLDRLVRATTGHLQAYRTAPAARGIETFLDELTNWYIRRSRDRFWAPSEDAEAGGPDADKESAYQTLYEVLTTLRLLVAPFVPFVAEELHRRLVSSQGTGAVSCHLESWPEPPPDRSDERLEAAMATVLQVARNGRSARNANGVRIRQPLRSVTLVTADPEVEELVAPYVDLLRDELNVHEVRWAADSSDYVSFDVVPHYPKCGPRFGRAMPAVKAALAAREGLDLKRELDRSGRIAIELDGDTVHLAPEEVEVRLEERSGVAVHGDSELLVALDVELDDGLVAEGIAREVVHRVQNRRRAADLDYADRIAVRYRAAEDVEAAIEAHRDWIRGETLAVTLQPVNGDGAQSDAGGLEDAPIEGRAFALAIEVEPRQDLGQQKPGAPASPPASGAKRPVD